MEKGIDGQKVSTMKPDELMVAFELHDPAAAARLYLRIKQSGQPPAISKPSQKKARQGTALQKNGRTGPKKTNTQPTPNQQETNESSCLDIDIDNAQASESGFCCCACTSAPCICVFSRWWVECCHIEDFYSPFAALFLYAEHLQWHLHRFSFFVFLLLLLRRSLLFVLVSSRYHCCRMVRVIINVFFFD
jgi:hypothetical protein